MKFSNLHFFCVNIDCHYFMNYLTTHLMQCIAGNSVFCITGSALACDLHTALNVSAAFARDTLRRLRLSSTAALCINESRWRRKISLVPPLGLTTLRVKVARRRLKTSFPPVTTLEIVGSAFTYRVITHQSGLATNLSIITVGDDAKHRFYGRTTAVFAHTRRLHIMPAV